jgi:hypothetical protein
MKKAFALTMLILAPAGFLLAQSAQPPIRFDTAPLGLSPLNYFLFMIPPLAWNIAFSSKLDMSAFPGSAPKAFEAAEWAFRVGALMYPILMPIDVTARGFIPGLCAYSVGLLLYFASWLPLMSESPPAWSRSPLFLFAPAYLPLLWMGGVAIMSGSLVHAGLTVTFLSFHVGEYAIRYSKR